MRDARDHWMVWRSDMQFSVFLASVTIGMSFTIAKSLTGTVLRLPIDSSNEAWIMMRER
jgi:hypothetical protein